LSFEEVLRLKRIEEMVELYYNSNQFVNTLQFLVQAFDTPFALYGALADFFEKKGYFVNSPARSYRYQVLLEFAREYDGDFEAVYRELLTYDMYLRENLKSRPEFARDLTAYKESMRKFYKEEEENRCYLPAYEQYDYKQLARMTHMEPFYFPVWDMPKRGIVERMMTGKAQTQGSQERFSGDIGAQSVQDGPHFVLFDYHERNPLTGDAKTIKWG
jgi:hypothetical protein